MSPNISHGDSRGLLATGASLPTPTLPGLLTATARNAAPVKKDGDWREQGQSSLTHWALGLCQAPRRTQDSGWVNGWMDGWMDGLMDGWMVSDGFTDA